LLVPVEAPNAGHGSVVFYFLERESSCRWSHAGKLLLERDLVFDVLFVVHAVAPLVLRHGYGWQKSIISAIVMAMLSALPNSCFR
jgi:hypothetical protein